MRKITMQRSAQEIQRENSFPICLKRQLNLNYFWSFLTQICITLHLIISHQSKFYNLKMLIIFEIMIKQSLLMNMHNGF